ncbi:MAG TPA: bifunctional phosphoribosylaminoimidazolecarboxamide formyltransferase/IMP cyclohydrolase [Candidatus Limnocylindrales bacterium]|nr:bifunctional phosphoribosylaminoimidazolecarboxamide formyltransferase/IMP cyclohydrolase [Candidatus Limnocylindrales bacterium]
MSGIVVAVSGTGSNLRALTAAAARGDLGAEIALVVADRDCPALGWAAEQGIETALVPGGADATLAEALAPVDPDLVVLAGYMRIVGPATLAALGDRIVNTHPSLLPAFPGGHAVRDALAAGVRVTGCTVHRVTEVLDGGPILAQEAVPVLADDNEATLHERIKAVEHRLLPAVVARLVAERRGAGGEPPTPRRALLSVSDKTGLVDFARGLVGLAFELVSTGGTARTLREAGLPVTDVAAVTGFPEMLDGRVKTLHPRVHAGILADRRLQAHREALAEAAIAPFDLVVVNLYPFAAAAEREGITLDDLVEEIDVGGPSMVRAAAKNHASVAIVTSPARYDEILEALRAGDGTVLSDGVRAALAVEAFGHTAAYDARIAVELPVRMADAGVELPDWPGLPGASDPYPPTLTVGLEKVETLRYGENPHQRAARYRRPGPDGEDGPFAGGERSVQGKPLSHNNVLDAAAAAAVARQLRGPACVIVKHTNACGAAERPTLIEAWDAALAGDPVSAFGGVVAMTEIVDRAVAERLTSIFLEVVVAPGFDEGAREVLAAKSNLRLLVDRTLAVDGPLREPSPRASLRTVGGAVLVTEPDVRPDDPASWEVVTRRPPTLTERADLDLAWRLARGVSSNAIVLVKGGALIGMGSGQVSRVDAARQAVEKARRFAGDEALRGAACGSDAFYPFPDAVEVCIEAGVTAFAQPGGSVRDAEVVAAADAGGATMLMTGVRHFRH